MAAFVVHSVCFFLVLLASASACDRCLHQSKATYTSQISSKGCGYGSMASVYFKGGLLAAASPALFKQGAGCGACFKIICNNLAVCNSTQGVRVIVTESHGDDKTAFVLSEKAFGGMANKGSSQYLLNLGVVDVQYKRVPCVYKNRNVTIRVDRHSNMPYYLAINVVYQGGQTEISAVDVAMASSTNWTTMRRAYGAVWDTNELLTGPLKFRFQITSGNTTKYILAQKEVPSNWKNGKIYDAGVQITDLAQEDCYPFSCDNSAW